MSLPSPKSLHDGLLNQQGVLLIVRDPVAPPKPAPGQPGAPTDYVPKTPEIFIAVLDAPEAPGGWRVQAFNGHVDLGTGIRTSLAQIAAEEIEVPFERLDMVLGHTEAAPNQGPTIASATIQISAVPLRRAAAQAREHLIKLAAEHWQVPVHALQARAGAIVFKDASDTRSLHYGKLVRGRHDRLTLAEDVPLKPASSYEIVGKAANRVDIPAKATGELTFVHDVRVPGMRHGRVIRPPYPGRDGGDFIGHSLIAVDESSVAHLPGNVQVVVKGDFVGVVADREEQAIAAMRALKIQWKPVPPAPDLSDLETALRANPSEPRPLHRQGQPDEVLGATPPAHARHVVRRSYVWPYHMHGSIGPSCAVADYRDDRLIIWSGTQNPHMLRTDLDRLLQLGEGNIEIIRYEASGCYGRNCADDVCGDAALLAMAVGAPVRVQLTREQEHQWEPKGTAQLIDLQAATDADGNLLAYDLGVRYPSNDAPLLALLLTGTISNQPRTLQMGDRTAMPPYRYPNMNIVCHDTPPLVRASWLRGVSALPNVFAHESMIDELAHLSGADPLEYRLRHLDDTRARDLIAAVGERAQWRPHTHGSRGVAGVDGLLRGRGLAYARYIHSKFPGFGAAWAAWVVDINIDPLTGRLRVDRITVAQDAGMMVNPAGVRHQVHGNIIQALSRTLLEQVTFGPQGVTSREWGAYPIINFTDIPEVDVLLMPRQDEPPLGVGESASLPCAPAIANAIFDATGLRLCAPPYTAEKLRQALQALHREPHPVT
ncbi:xanthine dehydrogenase family protein molybdopterin-binding subunit [Bordetella sp. 02P26C-1]|uniref:xanthine dehydrogenase family protein molybdopterin-binding subunit n=1 Tax=Bordetella sp. 02P26C-1 TaxID=2683195 RepID=UPI0013526B3E|nr:molybdopterin cofactor-binding domain-containing protein [Bordetella sp. 02P26C-1]MVW77352.1 molybdopterin-dependent oxidoreductase [Bordetella sp. 02P26C-1]